MFDGMSNAGVEMFDGASDAENDAGRADEEEGGVDGGVSRSSEKEDGEFSDEDDSDTREGVLEISRSGG